MKEEIQPGALYIVATPIGNLEDITRRAAHVLAAVDVIAAEDTRHTRKLLQYLGITSKQLRSCHEHSTAREIDRVLQELGRGRSVALVSDAGTPLLSDPGFALVESARKAGIPVLPVPGASAITAALSVAGLPTGSFLFAGFLPAKQAGRIASLQELRLLSSSMVFFEAPHRISDFLADAITVFGEQREGFIGRELTKKFEDHIGGTLREILSAIEADDDRRRGEFVIVIAGCSEAEAQAGRVEQAIAIGSALRPGLSLKQAVATACELTGARKNTVYASLLQQEQEDSGGA